MAGNTSYLPPEIIEVILRKLRSVKSLLRFKSVCKSWNTIISDPVFVRNHLEKSKYSNNLFLCHDVNSRSSTNRFPVIKLEDKKLETVQVIDCTYRKWQELCSCDGVILLTDGTYRRFDLWNPSTRTSAKLVHWHYCGYEGYFGLCRDPTTDDFKVVIVSLGYYSVYSFKNKSWIILKKVLENIDTWSRLAVNDFPAVCVDGACYWVWIEQCVTQILYFDPRDDEFKVLKKPEKTFDTIYLADLRGSLCVYCGVRGYKTVRIWTKEKGIDNHSWIELMTVENVDMYTRAFRPLCFVGDKIVVRNRDRNRLLVYSPSEKRFEDFEEDTNVFGSVMVPFPCMESLFFPH